VYPSPTLEIVKPAETIFDFTYEHFELKDYQAHPHISAPVAV
jgi:thymidylate synthase